MFEWGGDELEMTSYVPDRVGSPDIILVWPPKRELVTPATPAGYVVEVLPPALDAAWIDIHRRAVPSFGAGDLAAWLERYRSLALPDGILAAAHEETGERVATAGSIAHSKDGMFPEGGQLAWVATVPKHRGHGLATWLSALATDRLLRESFRTIFLCTGDEMTTAVRVYLRLGYLPCLYASDQQDRWARICEAIGHPFEPDRWPTLEDSTPPA